MRRSVAPNPWQVRQRWLDNGLRVVVQEDHTAPVVAVDLRYGVGSRHERPGRTGLAHLFEHLMFQGSAHAAPGEHDSLIESAGGTLNAATSFDWTDYYHTVPSGALELALWLEADRMGTLMDALSQDRLDNQREVVKNERRERCDNVPYGTAWERLHQLVFPVGHPYRHTPLGSMADLDAVTLQDCQDFFTTYYVPGNAVLAIVGDVDADDAFRAVERYFGWIPEGKQPPPAPDGTVGPLPAEVREEVHEEVPADALYLMFRLPPAGDPRVDAAELASRVLGRGASSRLERRLVRRERLAQDVSFGVTRLVGGVSLACLVVQAAQGVDVAEIEAAVDEELVAFAAGGPTGRELDRAKAKAERSRLAWTADFDGRADDLTEYALLFGDPMLAGTAVDRIAAVPVDQVHAVAAEHLTPTNRAALTYRAAR